MQQKLSMQQKHFKMFLSKEAGVSVNNIEKESRNPSPKFKKIYILNIYREYLLCVQSNASGSFL